ncbi:tRNA (adenosine(37)-N6)-threonylcarbamoyltransferase complex transferase subunit TsaD [Mycoplasma bradburyae]|uniref:tRNA (adenosine(37)-N6)-threonylcarbamoyltransferase complex transferase subunit TsaD n=1 Tax=Mycoplasma bradburyae TaxID=2963128 RepID=UPI0023417901|nr:tRNA (adenosine(37)-N6)-threonylcarbamoyltransferase complex transferase subunit TsaD [Mycoplasma bradburyae]MDC4163476.1 tRNA (adenosine(37)-N6)-threonylcarbamoyltransferase complex transferase subunit TsaD [Mycoplasma bradburyae]MDC4184263.1 tRNA (adenosine(37)-N6)-threonylcarbamoyltransferase complex transferase subunit TsaD [Mycoplasma bradburyae]
MQYKIILGIESSCDDLSISISIDRKIVVTKTKSSSSVHANYGGVVPEIAARYHEEVLHQTLKEALLEANISINKIDLITYTQQPGLLGCLHVAKVFADTLGFLLNIEVKGINHLYGHIFSPTINDGDSQYSMDDLTYPALGLVVSGGHTSIYQVESPTKITLLDETKDDAIGEVYDKVGRALDLKYPAGPKIDQMFDQSKTNTIQFLKTNKLSSFSYSGFKSAVLRYIQQNKDQPEFDITKVVSSFQGFIIDDFINRVKHQINKSPIRFQTILLGGGVSANSYLREQLSLLKIKTLIPKKIYTGDNAAMIVNYTHHLLDQQ